MSARDRIMLKHWGIVSRHMHLLPEVEQQAIKLVFDGCTSQEEASRVLKCTQANITYRLDRALWRLRFLRDRPRLDENQFVEDLAWLMKRKGFDTAHADAVPKLCWLMYSTSCASEVARLMGIQQTVVRSIFLRMTQLVARARRDNWQPWQSYYVAMKMTAENPNVLREVIKPLKEGEAEDE